MQGVSGLNLQIGSVTGWCRALGLLAALLVPPPAAAAQPDTILVTLFYGRECPHCEAERQWLAGLSVRHSQVRVAEFEVWHHAEHRARFAEVAAAHGLRADQVPATFLLGRAWVGFSSDVAAEIEAVVRHALQNGAAPPSSETTSTTVRLPFLGPVDLTRHSLVTATVLIAFIDGFNPCSLWVLTLLLGIVINSGSRARILLVGGTFLSVTALIYGLFIAGLFTVLSFVGFTPWVRAVVAAVAGAFGLINIKDYFWYRAGMSLTIPESRKPGIYRGIREVVGASRSAPALIGATMVLAAGITLVELPCTAGFPVLWSGLVAGQATGPEFGFLLATYILVYLLDELAVFTAVVVTLQRSRFEEQHGRLLKLVGGVIMLALAITLVVAPQAMNTLRGSLAVFSFALLLAALIVVAHRTILPRFARGKPPGTGGGPDPD